MRSVELVLYEEEFQRLDQALKKLRQEANARAIFLIDSTPPASRRSPPATSPPPTDWPS